MTRLTEQFEAGLHLAIDLHRKQARKATTIPYVSHLLGVASLVLDDGGTEEEAVAGLLHDAIEDCHATREEFCAALGVEPGERVYAIVEACTDGLDEPVERDADSWWERKSTYLAQLQTAPRAALRVAAADKLHNARAILTDLREHGPVVWERFNADATMKLWYYRSAAALILERHPGALATELAATVAEIARVVDQHAEAELDDDVVPAVFDCFIGGYMGTSYRVHLDGEV
ncbi:MAG: bifunctional (p)ppGpp synthetase/guanosine-3',5'-bis(diphosphate) 3'-pyrophosphohydrolase, partial [Actinobacteria bacterium]|nr:bifunctional (p)ppGpp synthetase/guanosine-3',5'-bis(diphosphate) 3'-pyrophosphohydrolase [Actinomycetota bacterium]